MQRDVDLVRQLLLDIERRGAACPIDALRTDGRADGDERFRYHLQLLTDDGLIADVVAPAASGPCVRLTHVGHEFVELARSEAFWREAKAAVSASAGGMPLTLLRALLTKRAWREIVRNERPRVAGGRRERRYVEPAEPELWLDACGEEADTLWDDDQSRLVRQRAEVRQRQRIPGGWEADLYCDVAAELAEGPPQSVLPEHLI
jgi:hypothetical protein